MHFVIPPSAVYQEYEARVNAAVLQYHRAAAAQPVARQSVWVRFRLWWSAARQRQEQALPSAEKAAIA